MFSPIGPLPAPGDSAKPVMIEQCLIASRIIPSTE